MNVYLPSDLKRWLDEQVEAGGYGTAGEYVRELLGKARLRQQRRTLDGMLVEAVEQGADIVMDDADWASIRRAASSQAAKRGRKKRIAGSGVTVRSVPARSASTHHIG